MKLFPRQSRRGFAVLVALVAVAVLSMLAGALAIFMKVESQLAQNGNDNEELLWLGRAGVERACWILANEPPGPTSLQQIWAGGGGVGAETNGPLMGISLDSFPVGDGAVSLHLVEQESKINVNGADSQLLQQVLTSMGADAGVLSVVADSIQDWVDADNATRPAGAESDYYQGLTPPYYAKDAPIDDIEELQLIKGVTPEMFKGGPPPGGSSPFHHKLGFGNAPGQEPDYAFGLRDVLTPYSNGKINVNTADANVLTCIPGVDATAAQNIITFRSSQNTMDNSTGVIRDLNQLTTFIPNPLGQQQVGRYCAVGGSTYEVHATAQAGLSGREFVAVVFRADNGVQIFSFHPK